MEDVICLGLGVVLAWVAPKLRRKPEPVREKQCASTTTIVIGDAGLLMHGNERCVGVADPRCNGGNCSLHCQRGGCAGRCLE
jgi:hypothetical protein